MLMKKMIQFSATALMVSSVLFTSCKKDDDGPKSNTEKLTVSAWKFDNIKVDLDNDGTGETSGDSFVDECEKDNLIVFLPNGNGSIDEGGEKCDPQEPQTTPFTWTFKENETIINFPTSVVLGVDGDVKLVSLTENSMVLSGMLEVPPVGNRTVFLTLKH
jgi:hypothetical protein